MGRAGILTTGRNCMVLLLPQSTDQKMSHRARVDSRERTMQSIAAGRCESSGAILRNQLPQRVRTRSTWPGMHGQEGFQGSVSDPEFL